MVDIQDINKTLETAYKVESVLHTLLDFEDVLERTNIYAYDNWSAGEIALGPDIDKYWVTVTLMYPHRLMPDPAGAERLLKIGATFRICWIIDTNTFESNCFLVLYIFRKCNGIVSCFLLAVVFFHDTCNNAQCIS